MADSPRPSLGAGPDERSRDGPSIEAPALPGVVRTHLLELTGPLGIIQFAQGRRPDPASGTCTDDVARALVVDLLHARETGWETVASTAERSLDYLAAAFDPETLQFRNQRADDGQWRPVPTSQDCQGRAMLALASAATEIPDETLANSAATLLERACACAGALTAPRGITAALLGCVTAAGERFVTRPETAGGGRVRPTGRALELLARRLGARFARAAGDAAWPWPESRITYESWILPEALIAAGSRLGGRDLTWLGRRAFDWLLDELIDEHGIYHPVGNRGWWRRGGRPAIFDQQPIEAGALLAAADTAHALTGDERYRGAAEAAFGWFIGRNAPGLAVADPIRGASFDGLGPDGLNDNQGAESTLAWLGGVEHVRAIRRRAADGSVPSQRTGGGPHRQRGRSADDIVATAPLGQRSGAASVRGSGRGQFSTYSRTAR